VGKNKEKKMYLEADIKIQKETNARKEKAAKIIDLPGDKDKQPDLLYFSAIFVSSGENLNHAFFLPSELVKSEGTIVNKALDVEHEEDKIIGHIYERAFMDKEGNSLDIKELASKEAASLDKQEIHVAIAGILYKSRFPNIAKEVSDNNWKVSMEAYYQDYDVKVGDLILSRKEAESLGLSDESSIFGCISKVFKKGKEIASGRLTRVLRGLMFSGCGIVKNPANPDSIIMETAKSRKIKVDDSVIMFNLDEDNNVIQVSIEDNKEEAEITRDDTVGICVSYQRWVYGHGEKGPDTEILHEDWCTLYEDKCSSFSRDVTDPNCLKNKMDNVFYVSKVAKSYAKKLLKSKEDKDKREVLVNKLRTTLCKATKYLKRR